MQCNAIFAEHVEAYRAKGFWPRPIKPGTKACKIVNWERPDTAITLGELRGWNEKYAACGIGLCLGSPFPDGTKLAAIDIDRDTHDRVIRALFGEACCGRVGARGAAYFVRLRGNGSYQAFKVPAKDGLPVVKIGELLCDRRLCVIPPTIHPDTSGPYYWLGPSLLDIDYRDLPIVEA
jgi:hypothetical protein